MSNMLKDAIVDAKALRESALKNAESVVIEKYSDEVRKTLDHILEQDDLALDMGGEMAPEATGAPIEDPALDPLALEPELNEPIDEPMLEEEPAATEEVVENEGDLPFGATDGLSDMEGKNLNDFPSTGEEVEVSIDLGALQEALQELQDGEDVEINLEESSDEVIEEEDADADQSKGYAAETDDSAAKEEAEAEEFKNLDEDKIGSLVDAIAEKLTVDMGAELSGWAGRPTSQLKHEQERDLAGAQSDDVKEELKDLNKAQEELVAENNQLKEQLDQYKQATQELKENLQDVNLSNARLLYTNRVLRNTSLNERQKEKIVEAISGAGSVMEARTIFETLQSTVESTPKHRPQSLSEAVNRNRTSVIRATRKEEPASDPFQNRMQKLAGIK